MSELISLRTRDRISLTQALEFRSVPKSAEEEAHRVVELGLAGSKVQAGSGPDRELEVVREVRSVLPSQTSLMVDGNAWWCLGEHKYTHPEIDQFGSGALAFENWGTPLNGVAMAHFGICFNEKTIKWLEWPCLSDGGYLKSHFSTLAKKF